MWTVAVDTDPALWNHDATRISPAILFNILNQVANTSGHRIQSPRTMNHDFLREDWQKGKRNSARYCTHLKRATAKSEGLTG
jgi:hypothetical protein